VLYARFLKLLTLFLSRWLLDMNVGLLDQLLAMRFIKRGISKVGGDPDKVTIPFLFFYFFRKRALNFMCV
jgi:hypothetical protein